MGRTVQRLRQSWGRRSVAERSLLVGTAVAVLGAVVHQLMLVRWYIEDAAISFTFARNLASGDGLVAYVGGERVEGYSNPLWTFLLAAFEVVGVSGFTSSKLLAALFVALTVVFVVDAVRRVSDGVTAPLLTGALLALNPQLAIWGASGLENSLYNVLLAAGLWLFQREREQPGRWPLSALALAGLALTRPEGVGPALLFGLWTLALGGRWLLWGALFALPFGAHQLWRQAYFGWPLANTYYAKLGEADPEVLRIDRRGWGYVLDWGMRQWQIGLFPLWALAVSGVGRRRWLAPFALGWLVLLLVLVWFVGVNEASTGARELWTAALWASFGGMSLLLPWLGRRQRGMALAGLCLHLLGFGIFFAVYANGDWMKGWRWMSLVSVPITVLTAVGTVELARALAGLVEGKWSQRLLVGGPIIMGLVLGITGLRGTAAFAKRPETGPYAIERRVEYMHGVQRRLHLDHVVNLDVDMGGTMWWSGHEIVDIAGLVDVPIAHHDYQHGFVQEYLFEERRPDFAHVHGGWASKLGIHDHPEWEEQYLELPPYPTGGGGTHPGNHVAKRHIVVEDWPLGRQVRFFRPSEDDPEQPAGAEYVLRGWEAPVAVGEAGGTLYLEVALMAQGVSNAARDARIMGFLAWPDAEPVLFEIAPGYDWYPPHRWEPGEIVRSRLAVPLPHHIPDGPADLGFFVMDAQGVMPVHDQPSTTLTGRSLVVDGEVRWRGAVRIEARDRVTDLAISQLEDLSDLAYMADCEGAEEAWDTARAFRAGDARWVQANRAAAGRAIAECWMAAGTRLGVSDAAVDAFARSRWWNHRLPGYNAATEELVQTLVDRGRDAIALEDWSLAYEQLNSAVRVDPRRSDARRLAEHARNERLLIMPRHADPILRGRERRRGARP